MATGFRVLGYADLDTAHAFIRDCEAEGCEGVSPETYGTRPANGIIRAPLPLFDRDLGYLTEDELIDMIDSGDTAETDDIEEFDAVDSSDETDEIDLDDLADDSGVIADAIPAVTAESPAKPAASIQDLPVRIGSRRELARLGIELFESRMEARRRNRTHHDSWKRHDAVKQYRRHGRRNNGC